MFIEPVFGKKFFGREEVLGTLQKRVTSLKGGYRQNMALTGPMLAGKSSILRLARSTTTGFHTNIQWMRWRMYLARPSNSSAAGNSFRASRAVSMNSVAFWRDSAMP